MTFNYNKLRGRIIENYGSITAFATVLEISTVSLSMKLNNKMRFTSDDIIKIVELLGIPADEIGEYFFTQTL